MNRIMLVTVTVLAMLPAAASHAQFGPCWGDITRDQQVNVADLLEVIGAWGPCVGAPPNGPNGPLGEGSPPPPVFCPQDIAPVGAPDGVVNIADLLVVISTWGACPGQSSNEGEGYVVWCEDWANANFSRWSSAYGNDTNPCTDHGFNTQDFRSSPQSIRSQFTCTGTGTGGVHRGYGGLRFQGESVLPTFAMNSSGGIQTPHGIVVQFKAKLSVPYVMNAVDHGRWISIMTVTDNCTNAWHGVVTINISDTTMRLRPQHVTALQYVLGAPEFTRDQWHRVTAYINMSVNGGQGEMHIWQDGQKVCRTWFTRPTQQYCQFHWGLYGSHNNGDVTYLEDDFRIIKLNQPLLNTDDEPIFPRLASPCAGYE